MRRVRVLSVLFSVLAMAGVAPALAAASGCAIWELTWSDKCNNTALCGGSRASDNGHISFYGDGTAHGELNKFLGDDTYIHLVGDVHAWALEPSDFYTASDTFHLLSATIMGTRLGQPFVFEFEGDDDFGVPAIEGHYTQALNFNPFTTLSGPGVTTQIQVTGHTC